MCTIHDKNGWEKDCPSHVFGGGGEYSREKHSDRFCQNPLEPRNAKAKRRVRKKAVWQRDLLDIFFLGFPTLQ